MIGKNPTSTSNNHGAVVQWAMYFWSPGAHKSRWDGHKIAIIRQVTCRILQPTGASEMIECWRVEGIDNGSVNIQAGLDALDPGSLYVLELDVPADSMYRSSGPAGPTTGRAEIKELPPWLHRSDVYDYQVRPARFWFEVEPMPDANPPAMCIRVMHDDEENTNKRPAPARHQLEADPKLALNHVIVDWRPDWLRRGRRGGKVDIHPSGGYVLHGGKPTHIVLHAIGVPDGGPVSNIGAAINTFISNNDNGGVHYLVDVDGHVVKMCPETRGLAHANTAWWRDKEGLNRRSVGIEHAWSAEPDVYPPAQIRATVDLVRALKREFGIDGRNVAGHGEVRCIDEDESLDSAAVRATTPTADQKQRLEQMKASRRAKLKAENEKAKDKKSDAQIEAAVESWLKSKDLGFNYDKNWGLALHPNSRLVSCPGRHFDWAHLAARGVVPDPWSEELPVGWEKTAYSGVFDLFKGLKLRPKDDDRTQKWGAEERKGHTGSPVLELHGDLRTIGYAIPMGSSIGDGHEFTDFLEHAVKAFKARYTQDKLTKYIDGGVDMATAEMIKRVVAAYA